MMSWLNQLAHVTKPPYQFSVDDVMNKSRQGMSSKFYGNYEVSVSSTYLRIKCIFMLF